MIIKEPSVREEMTRDKLTRYREILQAESDMGLAAFLVDAELTELVIHMVRQVTIFGNVAQARMYAAELASGIRARSMLRVMSGQVARECVKI